MRIPPLLLCSIPTLLLCLTLAPVAQAELAPAAPAIPAPVAEPLPPTPPALTPSKYFEEWRASSAIVLIDTTLRLAWFKKGEEVIEFPVAVGKASSRTPPGNYAVQQKTKDPWWTPTADIKREALEKGKPLPDRVKPGPKNPLGQYFIRFNGAYALHGTNAPKSIGKAVSHGCVRVSNKDIAAVFQQVEVGDGVWVRGPKPQRPRPAPVAPLQTADSLARPGASQIF